MIGVRCAIGIWLRTTAATEKMRARMKADAKRYEALKKTPRVDLSGCR